jgi:hypothetical protein
MAIVDDRTANRNYPLPNGANDLGDDVVRLRSLLASVDSDMAAVLAALAAKAGTAHTHVINDITGLRAELDALAAGGGTDLSNYATLDGANFTASPLMPTAGPSDNSTKGATTAWVVNALTGKANASHGHAIADVTGLQTALDGKATSTHTHTIANITSLQASLDAKLSGTLTANATSILTNTTDIPTVRHGWDAVIPVANTTIAGATTLDFATFINKKVTMGASNVTFSRTNLKPGQCGMLEVVQGATARTWAFTSGQFAFIGATPVLSTTVNSRTFVSLFGMEDGRCLFVVLGVITTP